MKKQKKRQAELKLRLANKLDPDTLEGDEDPDSLESSLKPGDKSVDVSSTNKKTLMEERWKSSINGKHKMSPEDESRSVRSRSVSD